MACGCTDEPTCGRSSGRVVGPVPADQAARFAAGRGGPWSGLRAGRCGLARVAAGSPRSPRVGRGWWGLVWAGPLGSWRCVRVAPGAVLCRVSLTGDRDRAENERRNPVTTARRALGEPARSLTGLFVSGRAAPAGTPARVGRRGAGRLLWRRSLTGETRSPQNVPRRRVGACAARSATAQLAGPVGPGRADDGFQTHERTNGTTSSALPRRRGVDAGRCRQGAGRRSRVRPSPILAALSVA